MSYQTLQVRFQEPICFLRFHRPEANNTINSVLIEECSHVLSQCEESITIVVLEGLPEVFCFGADFGEIHAKIVNKQRYEQNAEPLYDLLLQLATGPYITLSHVRGKANAGGIGIVAASDIVLADQNSTCRRRGRSRFPRHNTLARLFGIRNVVLRLRVRIGCGFFGFVCFVLNR